MSQSQAVANPWYQAEVKKGQKKKNNNGVQIKQKMHEKQIDQLSLPKAGVLTMLNRTKTSSPVGNYRSSETLHAQEVMQIRGDKIIIIKRKNKAL